MVEVAAGENKARNKMNKKRTGRFDNDRDVNSQKKKKKMNKDFHGNKKHGAGPRRNDEADTKKKKIKKPKHLKRKLEQLMEQQGESSTVGGNVEKEKLKIEQQMKKLQERKEKRAAAFERKVREMAGDKFDEETFVALREKGASLETILQATGAKKESSSKEASNSKSESSSKKEKKNKRRKIVDTNDDTEVKSSKEKTATNRTKRESTEDDDNNHTSIARLEGDDDGGDNEQGDKKKKKNRKDKKKKNKDDAKLDTEKVEQEEVGNEEEVSPPQEANGAGKEDEEGETTVVDGSKNIDKNDDSNESPYRRTRQNKKEWDKRYCVGRKPVTDFPIGSKHDGKLVYVKPYGIFIDIGCHSDAFCHISRIQDEYIESIDQIGYNVGDTIHNVRVVEIDRKKKRITVSLQSDKMREEELKSINDRKLRQQKRGSKNNNKTDNRK